MNIPNTIGGYPVKVRVVEEYYTHYDPRYARRNKTDIYLEQSPSLVQAVSSADRRKEWRPIVPGISAIYPGGTAGTLGAIVYENGTGKVLMLSNHHVFVKDQKVAAGNEIMQPGPADGGDASNPDHFVGKLYKFVKIDDSEDNTNYVDCAVATINKFVGVIRAILDIGEIDPSPVDPKPELKVQKSGRTTALTKGAIKDDDKDILVNDGRFKNRLLYKNVFSIEPAEFGAGGDSGSLVCTVPASGSKARPVGLYFAGNNVEGLAIPIKAVMSRLAISFAPPDKTPPSVSFTTASGSQFPPKTNFVLMGKAADNREIVAVDVRFEDKPYYPATLAWTDETRKSAKWQRKFTVGTPGDYEVVARAVDNSGNRKYATMRVRITGQPKPGDEQPTPPPPIENRNVQMLAILGATGAAAVGTAYALSRRK